MTEVATQDVGTQTAPDRSATSSTIAVKHLWKVFGPAEHKVIGTPDADLSREELGLLFDSVEA